MAERNPEDEYFQRIEREQKAKLKAEQDAQANEQAAADAKALHWHKCGKCGADMDTRVFRGVEIEQCPACAAVLLDPGELQQLAGEDGSATFSSFFSMFGGGKKD